MIDVHLILRLQKEKIVLWHRQLAPDETQAPWRFIEENLLYNYLLWHEEDIARIKDIDPLKIVEAKRNIDKYNQLRNNSIEIIDEWVSALLPKSEEVGLEMYSETPGMMIDRLSIMSLKRYHMVEETLRLDCSEEHRSKCGGKVLILDEQIHDLAGCLSKVLQQLVAGKLRFKVYRQLKMYNDPTLNPELYKRAKV